MSTPLHGATGLNLALNSGAIAAASGNVNVNIAAAVNYAINGRFYNKAITASSTWPCDAVGHNNPRTPGVFSVQPAGFTCAYALVLDSAGTVTALQGPFVENGSNAPVPSAPAGKVLFGVIKVINNTLTSNGGFRPQTDALNAAGLGTTTYTNTAGHVDYV